MPDEPLSSRLYAVLTAADEAGRVLADRLGVGASDATALHHLLAHGAAGPVDLGRAIGLGSAAATALADRLERAGHVERHPHPADRRRLQLVPTERARQDVWAALQPLIGGLDAVEAGLDERERAAAARYLDAALAAYTGYNRGHR